MEGEALPALESEHDLFAVGHEGVETSVFFFSLLSSLHEAPPMALYVRHQKGTGLAKLISQLHRP